MGKPKVYITRPIPDQVVRAARTKFDLRIEKERTAGFSERLLTGCRDAHAMIVSPGDPIDDAIISKLPRQLKAVATYSAGYDHIDVKAARRRGIEVTNVSGLSDRATAETTLLIALNLARRVTEAEQLLKSGTWRGWEPAGLLSPGLYGRRLGIVGMGSIGGAVAALGRAFGMHVFYHNRRRLPSALEGSAVFCSQLEHLLEVSDVLSIHCPLNEDTHGLIGSNQLRQLPHGALVINTARGEILDEEALLSSLECGHIAGAGLDVFRDEPKPRADLLNHPRILALPHIGSATEETRIKMGLQVLLNLEASLAGKRPPNRVA
ncbi:MAG: D-glycerate dehydrogenase [Pseudomonadota bacterium]